MSPSRGRDEAPEHAALPSYVTGKRQRTLSFRLDDPPKSSRSSSVRRSSEAQVKRSRKESSSASSWTPDTDEERAQPVASTSQSLFRASPELADDLQLPLHKPMAHTRRSASLRTPTLESLGRTSDGQRPQSVTRSFTLQPSRAVGWEGTSSEGEAERRAPSPRRKRERARSLHSPALPQSSPTINGKHLERPTSASSPGLANRSHLGGSALRKDINQSSASSDALPATSPPPRSLSMEARRHSSRDAKTVRRKESEHRQRPMSEMVLPGSSTHDSLADVASYAPATPSLADEPTPGPREPTLRELIESVPLDQALSLYQSVNRGTQRALHETAFSNGARPTSSLSQNQSVESAAASQKHLLADNETHVTPEKEKRDRKKSLGLHFGSGKSHKSSKEAPAHAPELPPLTPTLTTDRGMRTPGERLFDDQISRAHLQTSPVTFARANECREYMEARYNPIFSAITEHRPPPNLVDVSRWRSKVRDEQVRMHGLAMSTPSVRPSPFDVPLIAGKPLQHRNKRTRDFEVYPDEVLAYLEAANSPKQASPPMMQHISPGRRRQSMAISEGSDHLPPLPRRDESYNSSIYLGGRMSDRGSSVSLPISRHRSPSVSSVPGVSAHMNGAAAYRASPPASPRHKLQSLQHSAVTSPRAAGSISRIGSVKAGLARTFRHRERTNDSSQRNAGSGSDVGGPLSPYMSETDQSDAEHLGRLRYSGSQADSLTRRGWRTFRGQTDHLHRIQPRDSAGPSILGGPLSDGDTMADLGSLLEEDVTTDFKPPLPVIDIDDEEEKRLNELLADANDAVSQASSFAPRCPAKIAAYLEQLSAYDLASRVASRQLNMPSLELPVLPPDIAMEVQRAARAERILRPAHQGIDDESAPEAESDRLVEEPEAESSGRSDGSCSSDSEHSEEKDVVPSHIAPRGNSWPVRRGPLRRQSLAVFHKAAAELQSSEGTTARQRRMTVATEHPQRKLASGMRPDPLPGVTRTVQAFEQILLSSGEEARKGTEELHRFFQRVYMANRSANESAAELAGSTQQLSHLNEIMTRQDDSDAHRPAQDFLWALLSKILEALLRLIALIYFVVRLLMIPLRLVWAILVVCLGRGAHSHVK